MKKFTIVFLGIMLTLITNSANGNTLSNLDASSGKELVQITPVEKITTSHDKISEGDFVNFKIINTNTNVRGLITKYEPNGWLGKEAILVIDQFYTPETGEKYIGTICLQGNEHNQVMEFFTWIDLWVRGGEVTILPNKNIFSLWRE